MDRGPAGTRKKEHGVVNVTLEVRGVPHYELACDGDYSFMRKAGLARSGGCGCGKRQDKLILRLYLTFWVFSRP